MRKYLPQELDLEEDIDTYEWWRPKLLIYGFNEVYKNIPVSYLKVGDESMSAIRFRKMTKGNLPHLSYIFCKPKQLGTEFKTVVCYVTGSLLLVEVQRGKEGMNSIIYHLRLGVTTACTKRVIEAAKGIGQSDIKGAT